MRFSIFLLVFVAAFGLSAAILPGSRVPPAAAQPRISDTPVPAVLPEATLPPTNSVALSPTPTFTLTPEAPAVVLEAAAAPGDINVRDFPDVSGTYLGSLEAGRQYTVTGVYFQWIQFEYPDSETGYAWVYRDLVQIIGDEALVPVVDPNIVPTEDSPEQIGTATAQALLQTPEFAETATAQARVVELPTEDEAVGADGFLPTYTPPADRVPLQSTEAEAAADVTEEPPDVLDSVVDRVLSGQLPPMVPIVALLGAGLLGVLISLVRR